MNIKFIILLSIFLILIAIFLYWNKWDKKILESYNTYDILNTMVSKKFSTIGTIYQYATKNLMVNFGLNIGQMIDNNVLNGMGLSGILDKYLDFSSNLNIQNLSLGIYAVPQLTLHAIENYLTFSGSISLNLNIGQLSLNNIIIFGTNVGNFNINNLQFELITDLTITMNLYVDEEGGEIDTTITFDAPQIKIADNLFTQFISGLASNYAFKPPFSSCPDCDWYSWPWYERAFAYPVCEGERQGCLGINAAAQEAYKLSKSGILSLIFGEFPKVMNDLINNGISKSLIAEIINDIPAIRNLVRNIFMGDQNIKNAVRSKVDCKLSDWSSLSACSGGSCPSYSYNGFTAGRPGIQTRTAQVLGPALNGGSCITSQTQPCNLNCGFGSFFGSF
jgi:hypothetical protein